MKVDVILSPEERPRNIAIDFPTPNIDWCLFLPVYICVIIPHGCVSGTSGFPCLTFVMSPRQLCAGAPGGHLDPGRVRGHRRGRPVSAHPGSSGAGRAASGGRRAATGGGRAHRGRPGSAATADRTETGHCRWDLRHAVGLQHRTVSIPPGWGGAEILGRVGGEGWNAVGELYFGEFALSVSLCYWIL